MTSRYQQLQQIIQQIKPKKIVEIGVHEGRTGLAMCHEALRWQDEVYYCGFDLFEDIDEETNERELNVKPAVKLEEVSARFQSFKKQTEGFSFNLVKGDTNAVFQATGDSPVGGRTEPPDLVFIDGGHSVETIRNDFEACRNAKVVVLDDFYVTDSSGKSPDIEKYGCNRVVEHLGSAAVVLPAIDPVRGGGGVGMVCVGFKPKIDIQRPVKIKTKNSVPDEVIQNQVGYSISHGLPEIEKCKISHRKCIFVSGGPSFKNYLTDIRRAKRAGHYIVCVKHSHDFLIENRIVPHACVLLDPRDHVKDFIENPHPKVTYYVASQVHPSTLDKLIEKKAKIVLYHAAVGAGEDKVLDGRIMVLGGSTSATRGVSVMHTLGFRSFQFYGYDGCYTDPIESLPKTKRNGKKAEYMEVTVCGKKFVTDPELTAQSQDAEKLLQTDIDIEAFGDGVIPWMVEKLRPKLPSFEDYAQRTGIS